MMVLVVTVVMMNMGVRLRMAEEEAFVSGD